MNAKLLKERMRTKAQRPDIVVAFDNMSRKAPSTNHIDDRTERAKDCETRRSA